MKLAENIHTKNTEAEELDASSDLKIGAPTIIAIGKQRPSWQQIMLLLAASLSVIIVFLIFIFTIINGFQIIPEYGFFKFLFGDYPDHSLLNHT